MKDDGMGLDIANSQFLLKYRVTPHPATGKSPAEMLLNRRLRTLLDLVHPDQNSLDGKEEENAAYKKRAKRNFDNRASNAKSFEIGQPVFARNYRDGAKWLQGKVLKKIGNAMFLIRTQRGIWRRHFDQLKCDLKDQNIPESESDEESSVGDQQESVGMPEPDEKPPADVPKPAVEPRPTRARKPTQIFDPSG